MSTNETFLSRWSRRKHGSRSQESDASPTEARAEAQRGEVQRAARRQSDAPGATSAPVPGAPPAVAGALSAATGSSSAAQGASDDPASVGSSTPASREPTTPGEPADGRPLELPSIDSLTPQSDFRPFMQVGVDASTRNAALAQLFRDPHFNVMDGLDVYIDDYNKTEPIPPTMLAKLRQLHSIGLSDEEIERWTADADGSSETLARTEPESQVQSQSPAQAQTQAQAQAESPAESPAESQAEDGTPPAQPEPMDETPSASIRVAQADPIPTSTRRDDAAAQRNTQETGGEDEGSRM